MEMVASPPNIVTKKELEVKGNPKPLRILLIDDDPVNLDVVQGYLNLLYECHVTATDDSCNALNIFLHQHDAFDLVLTDIRMPDPDGINLAIYFWNIRPDIPIVFMSGMFPDELQPFIENRYFLQKPFLISELYQVLAEIEGSVNRGREAESLN